MKKLILSIVCCFLALMCGCTKACQKNPTAEKTLKIGTNANFPPYETIDEKGELAGFDIDIGNAIGKKLNMKVEFKEFDFDALILALNKGQIDIILSGMSITESRLKEIAMVPYQGEPLTEISFLFWHNIPESITSFADIKRIALEKKLPISVQSGHFFEGFLRSEGIPLKTLVGPPEQILDIKYSKSLAAAIDSTVGRNLELEHEGLKNVVLPLPKEQWDLGNGIGINKSRTDLIKDITRAVLELNEDGTIAQLKKKWFKDGH